MDFTINYMRVCKCVHAAQHNAAATLNRNNQELSASAPEFIPNFKPTPSSISGDWNYQAHHQDTSQIYQQPQQIYPQQNHSRPFQQQQQQQQFQRNYQGYSQQHQSNRNYRPDLIQNHHPSFSNQQAAPQPAQPQHHSSQQQQQQHFMMMNQQQSHHNFPQQGGHGGGGSSSSSSGGDAGMRGGNIQNRLNFNNSHQPESIVAHEPTPHKQVIKMTFNLFLLLIFFIRKHTHRRKLNKLHWTILVKWLLSSMTIRAYLRPIRRSCVRCFRSWLTITL